MTTSMPLLLDGTKKLGFNLTEQQEGQFALYYDMLVDWNSRMNLTAITERDAVQVRHFLDSLTVGAALLDELASTGKRPSVPPGGASLVDVGTGAGFPGVPLAILWPHMRITLTDSIGKKTAFLSALVEALGLRYVKVLTTRAEELGQDKEHRQHYSVATARAVASLPVLCEYLLPLLKPGGLMLAPKKGDISQELEGAGRASKLLGGAAPTLRHFTLVGEEEARSVVVIKKTAYTVALYPRRVGVAKAQPLGVPRSRITEKPPQESQEPQEPQAPEE